MKNAKKKKKTSSLHKLHTASIQKSIQKYTENLFNSSSTCIAEASAGGSDTKEGKEPACNAGDPGLIPGSGRSP